MIEFLFGVAIGGVLVLIALKRDMHDYSVVRGAKKIVAEIIPSICLGLSFIFLLSPLALFWFLHGDYGRYIWIINGPYPFSSMGSGPVQGGMLIILLLLAIFFFCLYLLIRALVLKSTKRFEDKSKS